MSLKFNGAQFQLAKIYEAWMKREKELEENKYSKRGCGSEEANLLLRPRQEEIR